MPNLGTKSGTDGVNRTDNFQESAPFENPV